LIAIFSMQTPLPGRSGGHEIGPILPLTRIGAQAAVALRLGGLALSLTACTEVRAQGSAPANEVLERVVITGSHIRQIDVEPASPVQTINRAEIERTGVTSIEQLLQRVSANVNGINSAQSVGNLNEPGFAAANLRGLGVGGTLVLLNGRRLSNYAFNGEAVDLNSIPLSAIDRVDVLKDGASAIYGTDAIGGVINVILRKDYAGAEANASIDITQHGGGNSGQASAAFGHGDPARDGYNLLGVISYDKQQALRGRDRDSTRTTYRPDLGVNGLSPVTYPANIIDRQGRRFNPAASAGCLPPSSLPVVLPPGNALVCGFDFASVADVLPEVERASGFLRGTWRLDSVDGFAEVLVSRNRFDVAVAPFALPGITPFGSPIYPATGPFYPTDFAAANGLSGDLVIPYRATELGPRLNTTTTDAQRFAIGFDGRFSGWDYSVAAVHSANQQAVRYAGSYVYQGRIIAALRTGLINPWGPSGPEGRELLASTAYRGTPQTADGSTSLLNAVVSRDLAQLAAGPLGMAIGAEVRGERLSYNWDPAVRSGDSPIGSRLNSVSGERDVLAVFAELSLPILRNLDAQVAARRDDYSDFGATSNPKVALRWQPRPRLVLRASWGEGFRAPPLYSLNQPNINAAVAGPVRDPIRCPITGGVDDCLGVVPVTSGGNPDLKPETSTQWNIGAVWEAKIGLAITADLWRIVQRGVISAIDPLFIVAQGDRFGTRVSRGPVDPVTPDLPGPITGIDASLINLGKTRTSGVDVSLRWRAPATAFGRFGIGLHGTHVREFDTQINGETWVSRLADAAFGPPVPRWRSTSSIDWAQGPWSATLSHSYATGYTEPLRPPATAVRRVDSVKSWDLQGRYAAMQGWLRGWHWAAGIRNLLDEDPPFSLTSTSQFGFNPQVASPLGRLFYLRATYRSL
jgi:iron complex outermembrane recepter protein